MRKALRAVLLVVIAAAAGTAGAAPNDFYLNLLRRGIAHVQAGNYDAAVSALRIAAFGLVDYIPQFQTAHIHLALANDRLGREADARHSLQRVLAAERVERAYASLALAPAVRAELDRVAGRLLTSDQRAVLYGGPEQTTPPQVAATTPAITVPPPPAPMVSQAVPVTPAPQPVPVPQPQPVVVQPPTPHPPAAPSPLSEGRREGDMKAQERYRLAVELYEKGRYADAKRELAAALPHIEITPEVARYRAKIEGAIVP